MYTSTCTMYVLVYTSEINYQKTIKEPARKVLLCYIENLGAGEGADL